MSTQPMVKDFFDPKTNTFSYAVSDPATKQCAIIDSVLDYDSASAVTSTMHADQIIAYVKEQGLQVEWILETHVHRSFNSSTVFETAARWKNSDERTNFTGTGNL